MNQNQNSNVAEACTSLSNMERVRCFWRCTTMSEDEFRKFICELCKCDNVDVFNFSPELLNRIFSGFVARAIEHSDTDDRERNFTMICRQIAEGNIRKFLSDDNEDRDNTITEFFDCLLNFYRDEPLVINLLLNFVRSVARNELKRPHEDAAVDFSPGIEARIWKKAVEKYSLPVKEDQ